MHIFHSDNINKRKPVVFDTAAMPRLMTAESERATGRLMAGDRPDDIAHTFIISKSVLLSLVLQVIDHKVADLR